VHGGGRDQRRYLHVLLRGMRAQPTAPDPLPVPPLTREQIDELFVSGAFTKR
jgi:hypothetical protein